MRSLVVGFLSAIFALITIAAVGPSLVNAQLEKVDCSGVEGSAICDEQNNSGNPLFGPDGVLTKTTQILAIATGVISMFIMIIAGLTLMTSEGEASKVAKAKSTIIYASIGIAVAALAQTIISFVLNRV